jgi:hypothetical protein
MIDLRWTLQKLWCRLFGHQWSYVRILPDDSILGFEICLRCSKSRNPQPTRG